MKRDLELMRDILLAVEECEEYQATVSATSFIEQGRYSEDDWFFISNQIELLADANFIVAYVDYNASKDIAVAVAFKLTWEGHEFLDSIKPPETWDVVKSRLGKLGTWTTGIVAKVAADVISNQLKQL